MSTEILNSIKEQTGNLSPQEKAQLADYLLREVNGDADMALPGEIENEDEVRSWRMRWLKENREKYAGKYVALGAYKLVGIGKTIREANEQAQKNGVKNAFLVRVSSENETLSGDW